MNKKQLMDVLSGFIDPRMVEALAEQAEGKGYFEDNTVPNADVPEQVDKLLNEIIPARELAQNQRISNYKKLQKLLDNLVAVTECDDFDERLYPDFAEIILSIIKYLNGN